jgi:hypothetical protein
LPRAQGRAQRTSTYHGGHLLASFIYTSRCNYMHAWTGLQHVSFSLSHYVKKPASFFACIYVTTHMYLHMYFPFFYMLGSTHGQGCTYGFDSDKNPSNTHMAAYLCRCRRVRHASALHFPSRQGRGSRTCPPSLVNDTDHYVDGDACLHA